MVLDGTLCPSPSFPFACIVLLKYDGSIFILSQWQLMGLFSCGPGGWWNSKQTFFLRGRRVLHHSGWGRHRRLCCVAITGGYGIQYTWPPPLNTEGLCTTLSLPRSFFSVAFCTSQHWLRFIKRSRLGELKHLFFKMLQPGFCLMSVMSLFSICTMI